MAHRSRRTLVTQRKTKRIHNFAPLVLSPTTSPVAISAIIDFFDMEASITPPGGYLEPQPLTMGPNQQPNDLRIQLVTGSESAAGNVTEAVQMVPDPPTGFTAGYNLDAGFETEGVNWRYLLANDPDVSVAWIKPSGWRHWCWSLLTARGTDPASAPSSGALWPTISHSVGNSFFTVGPVTVPGPGVMVFALGAVEDPEGNWPSWASSIGLPAVGDWLNLTATDKSGVNYYAPDTSHSFAVFGNKYTSAGTTGTVTFPCDPGSHAFTGMWVFLTAAPGYVSTGGPITATDSIGAPSSSSATNPHSFGGQITATDSVSTAFNPLLAVATQDPIPLDGNPVSASIVEWNAVTPAGSTATVKTSINNGLSWDVATNGAPIPRLRNGDKTTRSVLSQVTFTRLSPSGGVPYLTSLRVDPYVSRSSDELIQSFYGPIDKATTKITAGSSGGTGSGSGGQGVTSSGGGMFGGGAVVKIHATDPSRLIDVAQWPNPFVGPTNVTYDQLLKAMVLNRRPQQTLFNQGSTNLVVPSSLLVWGLNQGASHPWQDIRGVAAGFGNEALYDANGAFTSHPVPDPRRGPVSWNFDHTQRPCIIGVESELDTSLICNGYIIIGQSTNSSNPVNAFAFDQDVSSKYNAFDPPIGIGQRFQRLTFSTLVTTAQCQAVANALLFNSLGLANTVTIGIVPHPGIALSDIVRINSPETGVVGRFYVQGYTLPDSPGAQMMLTCFRQTDNPN